MYSAKNKSHMGPHYILPVDESLSNPESAPPAEKSELEKANISVPPVAPPLNKFLEEQAKSVTKVLEVPPEAVPPLTAAQEKSLKGAEAGYKLAIKNFSQGDTTAARIALEKALAVTNNLLKQELTDNGKIQVRLFRAKTYELIAKASPAGFKVEDLLQNKEAIDPNALRNELTKIEGDIGNGYKFAKAEIAQALAVASQDTQKKTLNSIRSKLGVAEIQTKTSLYSLVVSTQLRIAEEAAARVVVGGEKLNQTISTLTKEHEKKTWTSWEGLVDRIPFYGSHNIREKNIEDAKSSAKVLEEGNKVLNPAIQSLRRAKQLSDQQRKEKNFGAALNTLKTSVDYSVQHTTKDTASLAQKVSGTLRPLAIDISSSVVTSIAMAGTAATGVGAVISPLTGAGAGTTVGTGVGAVWDIADGEIAIFLGQKTRKDVTEQIRAKRLANAGTDAKRAGVNSVATVFGAGAGNAALKATGGAKAVSAIVNGATQGMTGSVLDKGIQLFEATKEFFADKTKNVEDPKQRLENFKEHLRLKGLTLDKAAQDAFISAAAGGLGGAIGAKADSARAAASTATRRAAITSVEAATNAGVDLTVASVQNVITGEGALTNEQKYSTAFNALIGGLMSHRTGPHPTKSVELPAKTLPKIEVLRPNELPKEVFHVGGVTDNVRRFINDQFIRGPVAKIENQVLSLKPEGDGIFIGRGVEELGLKDHTPVSWTHCAVWKKANGNYIIRDGDGTRLSTNGTFVLEGTRWVRLIDISAELPPGTKVRLSTDGPIFTLGEAPVKLVKAELPPPPPATPAPVREKVVRAPQQDLRPVEEIITDLKPGSAIEIGRGKDGIRNQYVSSSHAKIQALPNGTYLFTDLSRNGSFFLKDGQWISFIPNKTVSVQPGTKIRLGSSEAGQGYEFEIPASSRAPNPIAVNEDQVSPARSKLNMGNAKYYGSAEALSLMEKNKLDFKNVVKVDNAIYTFTDGFVNSDGRLAFIAKVEVGGQSFIRTYYKSNSAGEFRLMAAYVDRGAYGGWYHKGPFEEALSVPSRVQEEMGKMNIRTDVPGNEARMLLETSVPQFSEYSPERFAWEASSEYVGQHVEQISLLAANKEPLLKRERGYSLRRPADITYQNPLLEPDYSKLLRSSKMQTKLSGEVDVYIYASKNNELQYTVYRDSNDKICIAKVEASSPINEFGLRGYGIPGDMTAPLWEYTSQIPYEYLRNAKAHPQDSYYSENWNYIKEIPQIKDWYRVNGIPIPKE